VKFAVRASLVLALLMVLMGPAAVWAQSAGGGPNSSAPSSAPDAALGSIHGVAGGTNGEVYEGVAVTLTEDAAGAPEPRTQTTGADGSFTFTGITPGPFHLTLASRGFVTQTISQELQAGESFDAHTIVLAMATTTSSVEVTASQQEIAQAQLNVEEKQRVLGVLPNFYVSYDPHAVPLTTRQKFQLALRSTYDPVTFVVTGAFAGIEQANNSFPAYGQGAQGYAKRYGAAYGDTLVGTMLGGAILPSLLKQDPRYFVKGTGSVKSRIWYATFNAVMCKGDNGRWQPNYSGIIGGLAAGGVSNLYYPSANRNSAAQLFNGAAISIGGSVFTNMAQEFLVKHFTPHAGKSQATPAE
jgi:hypothetical protein